MASNSSTSGKPSFHLPYTQPPVGGGSQYDQPRSRRRPSDQAKDSNWEENYNGRGSDKDWSPLSTDDIVGKCKIVREIGAGGMGTVYLARHITLEIDVALKILPPAISRDAPKLAQRFIREAQLAARIHHPHVVTVMDADFDQPTELYYIVLEYMPGGSLADRLQEGALPECDAAQVVLQVAQALVVAAENGIVHRDVKPDNIMLDAKGVAKLADLGVAKQEVIGATTVTQDGASIGTPAYMSPDQIRNARGADAQDDIYSLGATFYQCLTGFPPFKGDNAYNIISAVLSDPSPDPAAERPGLSKDVAEICRRMMAKDKHDRYLNAHEVVRDLRALGLAPGSTTLHMPIQPGHSARRPSRAPAPTPPSAASSITEGPVNGGFHPAPASYAPLRRGPLGAPRPSTSLAEQLSPQPRQLDTGLTRHSSAPQPSRWREWAIAVSVALFLCIGATAWIFMSPESKPVVVLPAPAPTPTIASPVPKARVRVAVDPKNKNNGDDEDATPSPIKRTGKSDSETTTDPGRKPAGKSDAKNGTEPATHPAPTAEKPKRKPVAADTEVTPESAAVSAAEQELLKNARNEKPAPDPVATAVSKAVPAAPRDDAPATVIPPTPRAATPATPEAVEPLRNLLPPGGADALETPPSIPVPTNGGNGAEEMGDVRPQPGSPAKPGKDDVTPPAPVRPEVPMTQTAPPPNMIPMPPPGVVPGSLIPTAPVKMDGNGQPIDDPSIPAAAASASIPSAPEVPPGSEDPEMHRRTAQISAFQARALADQQLDPAVRDNVMQISGARQKGNRTPNVWRFLFWDKSASKNVRAVTVKGQTVDKIDTGYVDLISGRLFDYKADEIIPASQLLIDSNRALDIAENMPELQGLTVLSSGFLLKRNKGKPPVWNISITIDVKGHAEEIGEVRVSTESGEILGSELDRGLLKDARK